MAPGDVTLVNHGVFEASGAAIATQLATITNTQMGRSGAGIYFVPMGHGQVHVYEVNVAHT